MIIGLFRLDLENLSYTEHSQKFAPKSKTFRVENKLLNVLMYQVCSKRGSILHQKIMNSFFHAPEMVRLFFFLRSHILSGTVIGSFV